MRLISPSTASKGWMSAIHTLRLSTRAYRPSPSWWLSISRIPLGMSKPYASAGTGEDGLRTASLAGFRHFF